MVEHRSIITVTRFLLSALYEHTCAVEAAEAERRSCCQDLRGKKNPVFKDEYEWDRKKDEPGKKHGNKDRNVFIVVVFFCPHWNHWKLILL